MADLAQMEITYPVRNTFIEYPAPRSFSLEEFMPEREIKSCPGSAIKRLESLEEDFPMLAEPQGPLQGDLAKGVPKTGYTVKNTFIHNPTEHPALRTVSLEEFLHERQTKSCPGSGVMQRLESLEEEPDLPDTPVHVPATPIDSPIQASATALQFAALGGSSLEDFLRDQKCESLVAGSEQQQVASDRSNSTDEGLGDPPVVINLSSGLGLWSVGSAGHEVGRCKPCAFVWKNGCADGEACPFCHLCPPNEQKRRKKEKLAFRKMVRSARQGLRVGLISL